MDPPVKLQHISTFLLVYRERSFSAAAARGYATQSGLSMQIKELEDKVGFKLFERSTRGVEPTPAGERFYAHAVRIMNDMQQMRQSMQALKGEVTGSITAGVMPTFSRSVLAPVVSAFNAKNPAVKLKVIEAYSTVLTEAVIRGELDFAIVPPTTFDTRIRSMHVSRDREMLVTGAGTHRRNLAPISIAELGPMKIVLPSQGNARRTRLDAYLSGIGAQVESIIEMDAMMGTLELVASSDWVSILPATVCFPDFDGRARIVHPLAGPSLFVDYVLVEPAVDAANPAVQLFVEAMVDQIRALTSTVDRLLAAAESEPEPARPGASADGIRAAKPPRARSSRAHA